MSLLFEITPALAGLLLVIGLAFLHPQLYFLSMVIVSSAQGMPIFSAISDQLSLARWVFLGIAAIVAIATAFRNSFSVLVVRVKTVQILLLCFLAVVVCSSVYSLNPLLSYFKGLTFLALVLLFNFGYRHFAGDAFKQVPALLTKIGWLLIVVVFSSLAYAIIQPGVGFRGLGFGGLYGNPNALGAMLGIFGVPLFVHKYISEKGSPKRVIHGAVLLVMIGSLLATRSRAGMVAGFGASLVILFFLRRRVAVALLGLTLGVTLSIFSYDPSLLWDISQEIVLKQRETVLGPRELMWQEGIENIMEKPLWGWGFGTSKESEGEGGMRTGGGKWGFSTRTGGGDREKGSIYLGIVEELGFIGAIPAYLLMLYLIGQLPFILRTRQVASREEWLLLLLLYSVIISGLINGGFEAWLFSLGSPIAILYWVLVFLYFGLRARVEAARKPVSAAVKS